MEEKDELGQGEIELFDDGFNPEDLFNESNSDDIENEDLVIIEDDGKTIKVCKPPTPFEELHYAEYDKYLVPLFANDPKIGWTFRGNGVIVGPYLISAAHVAQSEDKTIDYPELYFEFEGKQKTVCDKKRVFDGRGYHLQADNLDDLIIYELTDICSPFVLNNESLVISTELATRLYCRKKKGQEPTPENSVCRVDSLVARYMNHHPWQNCFSIINDKQIRNGNSGGAVFRLGVVYGIISRAGSFEGTVIDAQYIKYIIGRNKHGEKTNKEL